MSAMKKSKPRKKKTKINTRWQDASECIICGSDTSETMGYCQDCEKVKNA
jgi:hypothetical protein